MAQIELLNETVTASVDSASQSMGNNTGVYLQAVVNAGVTVATLQLEASNDGVNWIAITGTSQARAAVVVWNEADKYYAHVRVAISGVTGTGNITITSNVKIES